MIAGQTHGATVVRDVGTAANQVVEGSVVDDARPALDDCVSTTVNTVTMSGRNIGDLLNDASLAMHGVTPAETPWRVLMVASEPRKLLDSDIVQNLNPKSAIADTSWIKPVKEYIPIRYSADLEKHLDEEMTRAEIAGAAGVTIDMMHRADQQMILLYRRAAKAAAEHHLMIEFVNGRHT